MLLKVKIWLALLSVGDGLFCHALATSQNYLAPYPQTYTAAAQQSYRPEPEPYRSVQPAPEAVYNAPAAATYQEPVPYQVDQLLIYEEPETYSAPRSPYGAIRHYNGPPAVFKTVPSILQYPYQPAQTAYSLDISQASNKAPPGSTSTQPAYRQSSEATYTVPQPTYNKPKLDNKPPQATYGGDLQQSYAYNPVAQPAHSAPQLAKSEPQIIYERPQSSYVDESQLVYNRPLNTGSKTLVPVSNLLQPGDEQRNLYSAAVTQPVYDDPTLIYQPSQSSYDDLQPLYYDHISAPSVQQTSHAFPYQLVTYDDPTQASSSLETASHHVAQAASSYSSSTDEDSSSSGSRYSSDGPSHGHYSFPPLQYGGFKPLYS